MRFGRATNRLSIRRYCLLSRLSNSEAEQIAILSVGDCNCLRVSDNVSINKPHHYYNPTPLVKPPPALRSKFYTAVSADRCSTLISVELFSTRHSDSCWPHLLILVLSSTKLFVFLWKITIHVYTYFNIKVT